MKHITLLLITLFCGIASFGQAPAPVTGPGTICIGSSMLYSDTSSGGTWSVGSSSIATITGSGLVTGLFAGTTTIVYTTAGGNATTTVSVVPVCPGGIFSTNVCAGAWVLETGCTGSGTWTSSNTLIATVGSATGIVSGITPGSFALTFTLAPGCSTSATVTVNPAPPAVFGPSAVCPGATISLGDFVTAGTWSSSNTTIATVGLTGVVGGASSGTDTIYYTRSGCSASKSITVNGLPALDSVTGGGSYCAGGTGVHIGINGSSAGVYYQLYSGGVDVGAPMLGTGGALDFGLLTAGGVYTVIATDGTTGCVRTMAGSKTITVNPLPSLFTVSGGGSYCTGSGTGFYIYLSYAGTGINYQLLYNGIPVGSPIMGFAGVPPPFGPDTAAGTYTIMATDVITGCTRAMADSAVIVSAPAPSPIGGPAAVCVGATVVETDTVGGGTWTTGNTAVATINPTTAALTGVSPGTATIFYTTSGGCSVSKIITVNSLPAAIAGVFHVCPGQTTTLTDLISGGTWAVNTTHASVTPGPVGGGTVTGISAGTDAITYSLPSGCSTTSIVTISALPTIYTLSFSGGASYCSGGTGPDLILSGSAIGTTYQIYLGVSPLGGALTGTGFPLDFGPQTVAGTYTATAVNLSLCEIDMSGVTTLTINPVPASYHVIGGGSHCPSDTGNHIGLDGSDAGVTYQLANGGAAVGLPITGTGSVIDFGAQTAPGTYNVVATNSSGCSNTMADSAVITVLPAPNVYAVIGGGFYCAGGSGTHVGLLSSDLGVRYQLFVSGTPIDSPQFGTAVSFHFGLEATVGNYTIVATDTSNGCTSLMSGSDTVGIIPLPTTYTVTGGGGYCSGSSGASIGLSSSATGVTYQLYNGSTAAGSPMTGTGGSFTFGLFTAPGSYKAIATDTIGCADTMAGIAIVNVNSLPSVFTVTGGGAYCAGGTGVAVGLSNSTSGINYQLYNGASAVGSPVAGIGSSLDFGLQTAAGVYTVVATNASTSCTNNMAGTATITITPTVTPSASISSVSGDTVCLGTSVIYTATSVNGGTTPGYQWFVDGVAVSLGSVYSYTPANGDVVSVLLTSTAACATPVSVSSPVINMVVNPLPAISGGTSVCTGSTLSLADTSGGVWTSSNPAVATIATVGGATGVVSGVGPGTATITYTVGTCTAVSTSFSVLPLPVISASYSAASCGGGYTLTGSGGFTYSWSPSAGMSCPACAVTDVVPSATTTYVVTGTDILGCSDTASVTVDGNRISGYISLTASGPLEVWLIQFDPSDSSLNALDSMTTCTSGGTPYYEFNDKPAGNYMVKAFLPGGTPGGSGYIPTYGVSSPHWGTATAITHASAADTLHIDMIYGTVPAGPGFIGGLISSGAGKNTDAAAPGMLVYLIDAASNQVLTYNYTDGSGAYSFSGLAYGSYIIYPEDFAYNTTPSPAIALNSFGDSVGNVNFKQHTNAKTITPTYVPAHVTQLSLQSTVQVYPNPTSGSLNIQWNNQATGSASVVITDVLGREVFKSAIDINSAFGQAQIGLGDLKSGIYLVSIKSESIDYNSKLIVQ